MGCSFYVEAGETRTGGVRGIVYLARHGTHSEVGRVLSGRSDIALDGAGRAEAMLLANRLAEVPLTAIKSSPRARAIETARIVAGQHALDVDTVDALDEIDFGGWSGRSFADLDGDPAWTAWNAMRGRANPPGGETMAAAVGRAVAYLEDDAEEGPILCVSHCDLIRGVVAHYLGLDFDNMLRFDCDPASLTTLALHDGAARVVAVNERP